MQFHSDYWVVVATAAPVIALAGIVSLGATLEAMNRSALLSRDLKQRERELGRDLDELNREIFDLGGARRRYRSAYGLTGIATGVQAAILYPALLSLSANRDYSPHLTAFTLVDVACVFFLLVAAISVGVGQFTERRIAAEITSDPHNNQPGRVGESLDSDS